MLIFACEGLQRCTLSCAMSDEVPSNDRNTLGAHPKSREIFTDIVWVMLRDILEP